MTDRPVNFVFDLDDTLYAEEDYVRSALAFVGGEVADRFAVPDATERLRALRRAGDVDPIATLWSEWKLPPEERIHVISLMHAHRPTIDLNPGAADLLSRLRRQGKAFAILTDGRSVTQRQKIAALACLDARYISISEEVGWPKTEPRRFEVVEEHFDPGLFVYVGDNPAKDFVAPNQRGWLTVMLAHQGAGIHRQDFPENRNYHPQRTINDFSELVRTVDEWTHDSVNPSV